MDGNHGLMSGTCRHVLYNTRVQVHQAMHHALYAPRAVPTLHLVTGRWFWLLVTALAAPASGRALCCELCPEELEECGLAIASCFVRSATARPCRHTQAPGQSHSQKWREVGGRRAEYGQKSRQGGRCLCLVGAARAAVNRTNYPSHQPVPFSPHREET